jgi:hypothetical protein
MCGRWQSGGDAGPGRSHGGRLCRARRQWAGLCLQAAPPAVLANWLEISTPAPVSSVNGKVGAVVLARAMWAPCRRRARCRRPAALGRRHADRRPHAHTHLRPPRPKRRQGKWPTRRSPRQAWPRSSPRWRARPAAGTISTSGCSPAAGRLAATPRSGSPLPARPRSWPAPPAARRSPRRAWPACPGASRPMAVDVAGRAG